MSNEIVKKQQEDQIPESQTKQSQELKKSEVQNLPQNKSQEKQSPKQNENKEPFIKIGIIINGYNYDDIKYYNEQFKTINKLYTTKNGDVKVALVFFGYRPEDDKINALEGVNFEYVKPVSFIHYFKQLKALNIGLLFIPLIPNIYNNTSENYNKFLEAGMESIATIAPDVYPYNSLIKDKQNGFMFGKREDFITYLTDLLKNNFGVIKLCGGHAHEKITKEFNYSKKNMEIFSKSFEFPDDYEQESENEEEESEK